MAKKITPAVPSRRGHSPAPANDSDSWAYRTASGINDNGCLILVIAILVLSGIAVQHYLLK